MSKLSLREQVDAIKEMVTGCKSESSFKMIENIIELQLKEQHKHHNSHEELLSAEDEIRVAVAKRLSFIYHNPEEADGTITYTQTVNE